ncbi:hybrid sensor histidine kinase/response regulator [Terasakiella sp. SH-1]|uniref:hybrid sensor histidine kinase/response regulator n=1 Tax=Terasakiella sp. SH-1 TaxID=2560057 RepID=UPI00107408EC|nr:hybrid sensor histidine kinase/response regulator [Terasakiella sp. SH-1]
MNRQAHWGQYILFILALLLVSSPVQAELSFDQFYKKHGAVVLLIAPGSGQIVDANPAASEFYGFSLDELRSMGIQDINALTREEVAEERQRAKAEKRNFFIFRHRLKDGRIKTVEVHSNPYEYQGKTVLISIIHDISKLREIQDDLWHYQTQLENMVDRQTAELIKTHQWTVSYLVVGILLLSGLSIALFIAVRTQRQAKEQAKKEHRQLEEIIWSTQVGTWEWNVQTNEVQINDRFAEMLGYQQSELLPLSLQTWTDNTHPQDLAVAQALIEETFANKRDHYETEFRMICKDGRHIWVASKGNVVEWSPDGKPVRMSGTHADITHKKKLETDLMAATKAAEAANLAKSEFLATMSHELRTPMMGIRGVLELLRENKAVKPTEEGLLDDLDESSRTLMALLDDILDLSKIEAGQLQLDVHAWEPAKIVESIVHLFIPSAQKKEIQLTTNALEYADYWCRIDDIRIRQIISNLVSNAVKFTPEGTVHVGVTIEPDGEKDTLIIAVKDSGIGIAQDKLESIFQRFQQADQSTTKKYGGTGLGLAISHELSEMMGGVLSVESELGKGTVFSLSLPVTPAQKPHDHQTVQKILKPLKILMAEDNPINQKVVTSMLNRHDHQVLVANNGREAVEMAAQDHFDLVLMDIQMPEMDGMEAARRIRQSDGPNAKKPIIAFTADAIKEHRQHFLDAGIDAVVIKPVKFERLFEEISKLLER